MARTLAVTYEGAPSAFTFSKVDRRKLYGSRRRVPLDPDGRPALRGALTHDGSLVLKPGMTAQGYFDQEGRWYPVGDLVGLDPDGAPLPEIPSTLSTPQPLEGPLPATALLDLRVKAVYALEPDEETGLDRDLAEALQAGGLFRFPYSYRGGYRADDAWLIANDTGIYAIVGVPTDPPWSELHRAALDLDEDDDFDDELDFEMF